MVTAIRIDRQRCIGAGQCVLSAPGIFEQSVEDGQVRLRRSAEETDADALRAAVDLCPSQALSLTES